MKTFLYTLTLLLILSSCTMTKYTHSQVMNNAVNGKTKEQILQEFGIPTEKRVEGNYEEWIYVLGQRSISLSPPSSSRSTVKVYPSRATIDTRYSASMGMTRTVEDYIKITFQGDKAIRWNTQGVDYTVTERDSEKTALAVVFSVLGSVLLGVLISMGM